MKMNSFTAGQIFFVALKTEVLEVEVTQAEIVEYSSDHRHLFRVIFKIKGGYTKEQADEFNLIFGFKKYLYGFHNNEEPHYNLFKSKADADLTCKLNARERYNSALRAFELAKKELEIVESNI